MVNISSNAWDFGNNRPIMPIHKLEALVDTKTMNKGDIFSMFIAKMSDGRFAIMDANMSYQTVHYEVHTEESLHQSFQEIE